MSRLSPFIRSAPKLFYVLAAVDFLKNMLPIAQLHFQHMFEGLEDSMLLKLQLFGIILSAIVYAATWIAYGVVSSILIALYDEVVALRVPAKDAANA
jgi:hypothetical protein